MAAPVRRPVPAVVHDPFSDHAAPTTMGDDGYINAPASTSARPDSIRAASIRSTSSAGLRTQAVGIAGATSNRFTLASEPGAVGEAQVEAETVEPATRRAYEAGMPIGLLAARGTPYAKKPLYRSRKCKILCPIIGLLTLAITILLTVFPILRAIAKHTLSVAVLDVTGSNITSPTNSHFGLTLEGQVHKVGVFPAHLEFHSPVDVYWIAPENVTEELLLGSFLLAPIGVAAGHGRIKQQTGFNITNLPAFARFTQFLITQEAFTWRLKSENVKAKAFGFIPANGLSFVKDLTLPGMANMTDVSISDFQLPGNDPAGGISLAVTTKLTNPSPFGVELGELKVDLYYGDLYLGPAQTVGPLNLTSGVNYIPLVGRLLPQSDNPAALLELSTLFSNYVNGAVTPVQARGVGVTLANGDSVDWLSAGIAALILDVPLSSPTGPLSPIKGITIESLSLGFDGPDSYAPLTNSSHVSADFGLPFGFSLEIVELANSFQIVDNRTAVAGLTAPMGKANTTLLSITSSGTTGKISLEPPLAPLTVGPSYDEHLAFSQFTTDLTTTNGSTFMLSGNTTVVVNTPLGQVKLSDVGFMVPAGLMGLESLAKYPTTIVSVDVLGGTVDHINLAIRVGLTNPSNLDLKVGDVTFQLFSGTSFLGTATLPNLHLVTGYQEVDATGAFQANNNPVALQTLTEFAQGSDNILGITGFNGSTRVESLTQAFMSLALNASLNGLTQKLINFANVTVLPSTGVADNFASSTVSLQNPFTSELGITNIQANVTYQGLFVGSIVVDTKFAAPGKVASTSPLLAFNLNLFPPDIFALLRALVVSSGSLDVAPLDGIVALGGYTYTPLSPTSSPVKRSYEFAAIDSFHTSGNDASSLYASFLELEDTNVGLVRRELTKRNIYTGFDLPSYVLTAFKQLKVDVDLLTVLHIGDFVTDLKYRQANVPAYTDSSLTLLLPVLARPIVQKIVDTATLSIETVMITDPTNTVFTAGLVGAITNAGPFDALISFPTGLTVAWNGAPLGQISMPNISLVADVGASLDLKAAFNVADVNHLSEFTGYLLSQPSFTWQIYGEELSVAALGIVIPGVSISKNVVLDGMDGFKNLVHIKSFDLPANDPAGGVALTLQTTLMNPSSVGVQLSTIGFFNTFASTMIGPVAGTGITLTPKTSIDLALSGRLIPQTTAQGLADVSTIFNGFIHGIPSQLVVHGDTAGPADCTWLNAGIKQLAIAVTLPAAVNLQVINSITIHEMTLMFSQSSAYAPMFSTPNTVAAFQLPFAFPIDITHIATDITAANVAGGNGVSRRDTTDFAVLSVPLQATKTDVVARTILLAFDNVPFKSIADDIFSTFLQQTTDGVSKGLALHGAANTLTSTAIGLLDLQDIAFTVSTSLLGLQGLNARPATISELDVYRGYPQYLQINVNAHLYNPSNITIGTGDVAFGLQFQGQDIGTAVIPGLVLLPGDNIIATQVHYQPNGDVATAVGQQLLENFVQGIISDTIIAGNAGTTPIASLSAALESIKLATTIPPLRQNLVTQANLVFPVDIGTTGVASATVTIGNPFTSTINIVNILTNATYQGLYLGQVNVQGLSPYITAPGHTEVLSPTLPLALNADPKALIQFIKAAAVAQGVDLGILLPEFSYVLGLASTTSAITTSVNPDPETCNPTGTTATVDALILRAVANLRTNLTIQSVIHLDEYSTPLNFVQNDVVTVLDKSVLNLVGLIGKTIVGNIVDQATLAFSSGFVRNVTDNGFTVALKGSLLNAGPFDASIEFPHGLDVIFAGNKIASLALPPICTSGGAGVPDLETTAILTISDQGRFTDFATYILLQPSFTWTVTTDRLRVKALGTIFDNVVLSKNVSFSAFNGLPGVTISNPDFPHDAPDGIALVTDTLIPSPSNLGIELGDVTFIASFMGEEVGPISGNGLTLAPLAVTTSTLSGTIIKRTSQASTDSLGVLFSQFLAGVNQTLDVAGQSVTSPAQPNSPVNWLSAAFKNLHLKVVLPGHVYEVISSVKLDDLTVTVTDPSQAYSVPTQNNATEVIYKNPFGFSLTAKQAGGSFFIHAGGVDIAVLDLPLADAVRAETSTGQPALLVIDFKSKAILQSLNNQAFAFFFNAITNTADVVFELHGTANVTAGTNAGDIPITGIPFNVTTDLAGLQSLNAKPTVVDNLDVNHGYPTYLQINADASIFNPSNITIITNDVAFGLEFQSQLIGSVNIGDLLLIPGANLLGTQVHYAPTGGASTTAGEHLLENYVQGVVSNVSIVGTPNTTPYGSLQQALGSIVIQTTIPPLQQPLITEAALTFPLDVGSTGIARASFHLDNPFTAGVHLTDILANATYQSFFLGQIIAPNLQPPITANGHQNITSPTLPFTLTTDPKFLIRFLAAAAAAQHVDLGFLLPPFGYVLGLASTASDVTSSVNTGTETCAPTGTTKRAQALIIAAVQNLRSDLAITSTLLLDDYRTNLNFNQNSVPTVLDDSVLYLTGFIGKTIVSHIVDVAELSFSGGSVTNVTDAGFTVALKGSLLNAGPFDALIEFPAGLDVQFQGQVIANIQLPPICSTADIAVPDLETTAILQITDQAAFTSFASYILLNPSFTWTVSTKKLRVLALGTIFDNVSLSKNVTFDAFNKLAPGVTVSNPDFPGDASNGIILKLDALVPSPSNLAIELGDVTFVASFEGQVVGPVSGKSLTLPAHSITPLALAGVIVHRSDPAGLQSLGTLFGQFLHGDNSTLQVTGDSVTSPAQPGSPVKWLSAAFKTLVLDVVLPGHRYDIISAITLKDLDVTINTPAEAFAVQVQNNETDVVFKNPFAFSLQVAQAGGNFIVNYNNVDAGLLTLPITNAISSGTSTGQDANLVIPIHNAVLTSLDTGAFGHFLSAITNAALVNFGLHGTANVTAHTAAGDIPIGGIPFSVQTSFSGIQGFKGVATIPATPIVSGSGGGDPFNPSAGGSDFLIIALNVVLSNPAPLILHTNLISFQVIYSGVNVGRAYINPLDLYSGSNTFPAKFHYQPQNSADATAQSLLTQYLSTTGEIPLTVQGDTSSSPYGSLQEALSNVKLATAFPGQGKPLVNLISIFLDPAQAVCHSASSFQTQINNNLGTSITLLALSGTASQSGTTFATFDYQLQQLFRTDAGQNPGGLSEKIPVGLTQGVGGSFPLLSGTAKGLDVALTVRVSVDGYVAPTVTYVQKAVPYKVNILVGDITISLDSFYLLFSIPGIQAIFAELAALVGCADKVIALIVGLLSGSHPPVVPTTPTLGLPSSSVASPALAGPPSIAVAPSVVVTPSVSSVAVASPVSVQPVSPIVAGSTVAPSAATSHVRRAGSLAARGTLTSYYASKVIASAEFQEKLNAAAKAWSLDPPRFLEILQQHGLGERHFREYFDQRQ